MKYTINFVGRENTAIGIRHSITAEVEAENREAAIAKLYDKYEHIGQVVFQEEEGV